MSTLMVLCITVILVFRGGKEIGNAFGGVVILVMLITTTLLTLVMIIIWRAPGVLVGLFFVVFFAVEGVYVTAVFTRGWLPFAISLFFNLIMSCWFNGRQRKIEYELAHKINLESLGQLISDPGVQRVPRLCFFTNIQDGLTPVLGHYIKNMKSIHKVTIFTTLRDLLVPKVALQDRIVVTNLGLGGIYGCVIRYGYADPLNLEGDGYVGKIIDCLQAHIKNHSRSPPSDALEIQEQISDLEAARSAGVVHVQGKTRYYTGENCGWFDQTVLGFYEFMHSNCRSALPSLGVPLPQRIEVGMVYKLEG